MAQVFVYNADVSIKHRFAFVGLFKQHIRAVPVIAAAHWSFSIGGSVRHPLILTLNDLRAFPAQTWTCPLACASADPLLGQAEWRGVPLAALLAEVELLPTAEHVSVYSADGYRASLTLERLRGALLAYAMDGQPLPPEHGFPARLIVPGLYGYKMHKWVTHIRLGSAPAPGFWEARGWPEAGLVRPTAALREAQAAPNGDLVISGVAYAGGREVGVEVSLDHGDWTPAEVARVDSGWTRWQAIWTPTAGGDVLCRVRATDASGSVQSKPHSTILRIVQERA